MHNRIYINTSGGKWALAKKFQEKNYKWAINMKKKFNLKITQIETIIKNTHKFSLLAPALKIIATVPKVLPHKAFL